MPSSENPLTAASLPESSLSTNALAASKTQNGVQSLEIGLSLLDILVNDNAPMMLKDIAQAAQLHPAKAHRYLVSLIRKGYACQLDDGRYALGSRVEALAALGHSGLNQHNLLQRLTMAASEIKDALHCAVQIAKWLNDGPIIIQSVEPDSPISILTRIGSRMPLTTSATGQLFASYQPETLIKPLVIAEWQRQSESLSAPSQDNQSSTSLSEADIAANWQQFTQQLAAIRNQGYATVTGDMLAGINAITIPVICAPHLSTSPTPPSVADTLDDRETLLEYAITVIGTSEQLPIAKQQEIADKILTIAKRYQIA